MLACYVNTDGADVGQVSLQEFALFLAKAGEIEDLPPLAAVLQQLQVWLSVCIVLLSYISLVVLPRGTARSILGLGFGRNCLDHGKAITIFPAVSMV